jgi:cobalt-zinc-cadmium efflux system membrane fusion protein
MKHIFILPAAVIAGLTLVGCGARGGQPDPKAEAPPAAKVEHEADANLVKVDHPDRFPVATAAARATTTELNVTGVVNADVSRTMPVISLASGRVVEIRARLGDEVTKGQLLMRVQRTAPECFSKRARSRARIWKSRRSPRTRPR